jgi:hypothetical protein
VIGYEEHCFINTYLQKLVITPIPMMAEIEVWRATLRVPEANVHIGFIGQNKPSTYKNLYRNAAISLFREEYDKNLINAASEWESPDSDSDDRLVTSTRSGMLTMFSSYYYTNNFSVSAAPGAPSVRDEMLLDDN